MASRLTFFKICNVVYRFTKYGEEIIDFLLSMRVKPTSEDLIAILRTGTSDTEIRIKISAYPCTTISKAGKITIKYRIAAGPNNNSVILLAERNNFDSNSTQNNHLSNTETVYEIIELVQYLFVEYVQLYCQNWY